MGKYRRVGYVFITWKGRSSAASRTRVPRWQDDREVDLDNQKPMKGSASGRILELIADLEAEGLL
jgi:hypothetical protein